MTLEIALQMRNVVEGYGLSFDMMTTAIPLSRELAIEARACGIIDPDKPRTKRRWRRAFGRARRLERRHPTMLLKDAFA